MIEIRSLDRFDSVFAVIVSGVPEKFCHRDLQCLRNFLDASKSRITCASLDVGDVSAMQPRPFCEFYLRNPERRSRVSDRGTQAAP